MPFNTGSFTKFTMFNSGRGGGGVGDGFSGVCGGSVGDGVSGRDEDEGDVDGWDEDGGCVGICGNPCFIS